MHTHAPQVRLEMLNASAFGVSHTIGSEGDWERDSEGHDSEGHWERHSHWGGSSQGWQADAGEGMSVGAHSSRLLGRGEVGCGEPLARHEQQQRQRRQQQQQQQPLAAEAEGDSEGERPRVVLPSLPPARFKVINRATGQTLRTACLTVIDALGVSYQRTYKASVGCLRWQVRHAHTHAHAHACARS